MTNPLVPQFLNSHCSMFRVIESASSIMPIAFVSIDCSLLIQLTKLDSLIIKISGELVGTLK